MRNIGLVTSGGDAPGMNAAIRAAVRVAHSKNFQVLGFQHGWGGLLANEFRPLTPRSVGGIIRSGGTILHTRRCPEFKTNEGIKKAVENLALNDVDGLIVIGGDGSLKGALKLSGETDTLIVGVPATIDNDVFGTDETIGFDTAVNTAVTEIDKIRDTAISFERVFLIEVMGRTRGFLALTSGVTVGAEIILVPEVQYELEEILRIMGEDISRGKNSAIIVAAEGIGDTHKLASEIERNIRSEVRVSVIGYAQRGGNPTARSRLLACLLANKAVELLSEEQGGKVVVLQDGRISSIGLEESCRTEKPLDLDLLKLGRVLAT